MNRSSCDLSTDLRSISDRSQTDLRSISSKRSQCERGHKQALSILDCNSRKEFIICLELINWKLDLFIAEHRAFVLLHA